MSCKKIYTTDSLVDMLLDSYCEHEISCRIDKDNMINKDILISVVDEIRKILFPGFFDNNKVRSEYARFLVGEKLEFIQYNLKKQIAKALDNLPENKNLSRENIIDKAEQITQSFLETLPTLRDYLQTDVEAAYNGDPAAFSTDEIIFCYS